MSRAQEKIREQARRIRELEVMEEDYTRLRNDYERLKAELALTQQSQGPHQVLSTLGCIHPQNEALIQELRRATETIREKDRRIQIIEEANNRVLFRNRTLQAEISVKNNQIDDLSKEITYIKSKLDSRKEFCKIFFVAREVQ